MTETSAHLHRFHGGLKLPDHKELSCHAELEFMRVPRELVIPVSQHIGQAAELIVSVGDHVHKGQLIAAAAQYISANVHASSSGTVTAIEDRPIPHPSGESALCVVIETDGKEDWGNNRLPVLDTNTAVDPIALRNRARDAGIVGLGGAAFPSAVKLNPGKQNDVHTLIVNAAECEPYITCDDVLMRYYADDLLDGIELVMDSLHLKKTIIGIEDNKPEAIANLNKHLHDNPRDIRVQAIPSVYPSGGEKQLIKILTGEEVPADGIPANIGMICQNVATLRALFRAVTLGEPLLSRIVTVTGKGVQQPGNWEVLIGTPMSDLIATAGGYNHAQRLIMGGPMMGFALNNDQVPIIKATNCLLIPDEQEISEPQTAQACIRCGDCQRVCPANLLPQQLYWHARAKDMDKVQDYHLFDCIECGCCSYVCPSHIPLVQYYRFAKTEIYAQEREKARADIARERHEFRQLRFERLEQEKAARAAKHKAALKAKQAADTSDDKADAIDPKKAAIQAALERAKAKKAMQQDQPKNTDNLTPEQQRQIDEADKRRAATNEEKP